VAIPATAYRWGRGIRCKPGDVFEISNSAVRDTARMHESGRIVVRLARMTNRLIAVLLANRKRLGAGVSLRERDPDFGSMEDLSKACCLCVVEHPQPWRPPDVVSPQGGSRTASAPPGRRGPAARSAVRGDHGDGRAARHAPADALRVDQIGWREDGSPVEVRLARFSLEWGAYTTLSARLPEAWQHLRRYMPMLAQSG